MPIRILIVNVHSCQNAGDAALMLSAIEQLQRNFPACQVTLAMNDPDSYRGRLPVVGSFVTWLKQVDGAGHSRWRWWAFPWLPLGALLLASSRWMGQRVVNWMPRRRRDLLLAYIDADLVVSCPGGYLFSAGSVGLPLGIAVYTMAAALIAGKPLYLLPQSIGPLHRPVDRWLVGWLLKRARLVMLREAISVVELPLAPANRQHVVQLPDMAVNFQGAARAAAEQWLASLNIRPGQDKPLLGITVMNWEAQYSAFRGQSKYEQALAAAARSFVEQQGGWVIFFPQVCGPAAIDDDRVPARRVAGALAGLEDRVIVVQELLEPDLLKSVYGLMDVFIATRLHSAIFAVGNGVPTLAISYHFKTRAIAQTLGIEQWVDEIGTVEAVGLVNRLAELWSSRVPVRAGLVQRLPDLKRDAERAGALVAADFAEWQVQRAGS